MSYDVKEIKTSKVESYDMIHMSRSNMFIFKVHNIYSRLLFSATKRCNLRLRWHIVMWLKHNILQEILYNVVDILVNVYGNPEILPLNSFVVYR